MKLFRRIFGTCTWKITNYGYGRRVKADCVKYDFRCNSSIYFSYCPYCGRKKIETFKEQKNESLD